MSKTVYINGSFICSKTFERTSTDSVRNLDLHKWAHSQAIREFQMICCSDLRPGFTIESKTS
eukprot:6457179-Amphidinium_carterae.1